MPAPPHWVLPGAVQRSRSVPWINVAEWESVFHSAYSGDAEIALRTIHLWRQRGPIPIAVDITASLLDTDAGSATQRRMAISMAVVRLVNGIADRGQTSLFAKSVRDISRSIDLPLAFVEIRHAATHNQLPTLALLLDIRSRALRWLHDRYWIPTQRHMSLLPAFLPLMNSMVSAVKAWSKTSSPQFDDKLRSILHLIPQQCSVVDVADVLVGSDNLLRLPRSCLELSVAHLDAVHLSLASLWADVIAALSHRLPTLMLALALRLFRIVHDEDSSPWRQAIASRWLCFCLTRSRIDQLTIVDLCLANPSAASLDILQQYSGRRLAEQASPTALSSDLLAAFRQEPIGRPSPRPEVRERIDVFLAENSSRRHRWSRAFHHGRHIPIGLLADGRSPHFAAAEMIAFGANVVFQSNKADPGDQASLNQQRIRQEPVIDSDLIVRLI